MWNDTDFPIAYLITFRCYGTWFHGDERGSIDRHNNVYGAPKYPPNKHWEEISAARLKHPPVKLDTRRRTSVEKAIRETCEIRKWALFAVNVRTNHAHVVSSTGGRKPNIHLNAFKANATRQMRQDGVWNFDYSPWADRGSERWLWTEKHLSDAIEYVIFGQGHELPKFE
jgi:REP element-mobilizing transposase RayT